MPAVTVKVDCKDILGTLHGERLGQFVASRAAEYMDPYVPFRTGDLSRSAVAKPWRVSYVMGYAAKVYNGSGLTFSTDHHPLATDHWDAAMASARGGELADDVSAYLARG